MSVLFSVWIMSVSLVLAGDFVPLEDDPRSLCERGGASTEGVFYFDPRGLRVESKDLGKSTNVAQGMVRRTCEDLFYNLGGVIAKRPGVCALNGFSTPAGPSTLVPPYSSAAWDPRQCVSRLAIDKFKKNYRAVLAGQGSDRNRDWHQYSAGELRKFFGPILTGCSGQKTLASRAFCFEREGRAQLARLAGLRDQLQKVAPPVALAGFCGLAREQGLTEPQLSFLASVAKNLHKEPGEQALPARLECSGFDFGKLLGSCSSGQTVEFPAGAEACLRETVRIVGERSGELDRYGTTATGPLFITRSLGVLSQSALELSMFERVCVSGLDFRTLFEERRRIDPVIETLKQCRTDEVAELLAADPYPLLSTALSGRGLTTCAECNEARTPRVMDSKVILSAQAVQAMIKIMEETPEDQASADKPLANTDPVDGAIQDGFKDFMTKHAGNPAAQKMADRLLKDKKYQAELRKSFAKKSARQVQSAISHALDEALNPKKPVDLLTQIFGPATEREEELIDRVPVVAKNEDKPARTRSKKALDAEATTAVKEFEKKRVTQVDLGAHLLEVAVSQAKSPVVPEAEYARLKRLYQRAIKQVADAVAAGDPEKVMIAVRKEIPASGAASQNPTILEAIQGLSLTGGTASNDARNRLALALLQQARKKAGKAWNPSWIAGLQQQKSGEKHAVLYDQETKTLYDLTTGERRTEPLSADITDAVEWLWEEVKKEGEAQDFTLVKKEPEKKPEKKPETSTEKPISVTTQAKPQASIVPVTVSGWLSQSGLNPPPKLPPRQRPETPQEKKESGGSFFDIFKLPPGILGKGLWAGLKNLDLIKYFDPSMLAQAKKLGNVRMPSSSEIDQFAQLLRKQDKKAVDAFIKSHKDVDVSKLIEQASGKIGDSEFKRPLVTPEEMVGDLAKISSLLQVNRTGEAKNYFDHLSRARQEVLMSSDIFIDAWQSAGHRSQFVKDLWALKIDDYSALTNLLWTRGGQLSGTWQIIFSFTRGKGRLATDAELKEVLRIKGLPQTSRDYEMLRYLNAHKNVDFSASADQLLAYDWFFFRDDAIAVAAGYEAERRLKDRPKLEVRKSASVNWVIGSGDEIEKEQRWWSALPNDVMRVYFRYDRPKYEFGLGSGFEALKRHPELMALPNDPSFYLFHLNGRFDLQPAKTLPDVEKFGFSILNGCTYHPAECSGTNRIITFSKAKEKERQEFLAMKTDAEREEFLWRMAQEATRPVVDSKNFKIIQAAVNSPRAMEKISETTAIMPELFDLSNELVHPMARMNWPLGRSPERLLEKNTVPEIADLYRTATQRLHQVIDEVDARTLARAIFDEGKTGDYLDLLIELNKSERGLEERQRLREKVMTVLQQDNAETVPAAKLVQEGERDRPDKNSRAPSRADQPRDGETSVQATVLDGVPSTSTPRDVRPTKEASAVSGSQKPKQVGKKPGKIQISLVRLYQLYSRDLLRIEDIARLWTVEMSESLPMRPNFSKLELVMFPLVTSKEFLTLAVKHRDLTGAQPVVEVDGFGPLPIDLARLVIRRGDIRPIGEDELQFAKKVRSAVMRAPSVSGVRASRTFRSGIP